MPIVVIVYVLMNISYLSAMSAQELFESKAVGVVSLICICISKEIIYMYDHAINSFISNGQKLFLDLGVGSFL